ncbi:MAG TPA: ATPase domain-containing protein, partial [Acidimicrobiales bacterium]|nr:ATPase domain-containing protein [Acidimicrobiales bacterium]
GSSHGTNEFPFLIDFQNGFSVVPVTSFDLRHPASKEVVPTGVPDLDAMISKGGWYRGSTTMISGESGTGKTTFAAHFADAACSRGERCLYFAFEESEAQILRNMASVGLRLGKWTKQGNLRVHAARPTQLGLESHLVSLYEQVQDHHPDVVVLDPITDFTAMGSTMDVKAMLMRIVDYLKKSSVTAVFTSLLHGRTLSDDPMISSLIDNWVQLRSIETDAQRNRGIYVQKARGMGHSNQIREFEFSRKGIHFLDVVAGSSGVLTGRARQEAGSR